MERPVQYNNTVKFAGIPWVRIMTWQGLVPKG